MKNNQFEREKVRKSKSNFSESFSSFVKNRDIIGIGIGKSKSGDFNIQVRVLNSNIISALPKKFEGFDVEIVVLKDFFKPRD